MSAITARNESEGTGDRRRRLRRSSDRTVHATPPRVQATCAEIGCDQPVWPGRRFCIWHPELRLARRREGALAEGSR